MATTVIKKLSGKMLAGMLWYGINSLEKHRKTINDLNVFPVPDGDTGTNMLLTLQNAFQAVNQKEDDIDEVIEDFARAAVFGARGNSGVIISQFFRGMAEEIDGDDVNARELAKALARGYQFAYLAVGKPVEGTILTVMRDAAKTVDAEMKKTSTINELIDRFIEVGEKSLARTPELLPVLKKAGVVDSGGAGLIYLFRGMRRFLLREPLYVIDDGKAAPTEAMPDYSRFNRNSVFEFGYCTEVLLQVTVAEDTFNLKDFTRGLSELGDSLVSYAEGDKVKVHIHTKTPEVVLGYLHNYGEFLHLKIENMSVQHSGENQKYVTRPADDEVGFAVVAVAPNETVQKMFSEMGANVVILSSEAPSANEFIEAFKLAAKEDVIVFPNSSNSILSSMQAATLFGDSHITTVNCRSIAECYSSLAIIDWEAETVKSVVSDVNQTIAGIFEVAILPAEHAFDWDTRHVDEGEFFAIRGKEPLSSGKELRTVALETAKRVVGERGADVITLFLGKAVSDEDGERIRAAIEAAHPLTEVITVRTDNAVYNLTISFE